MNKLLDKLKKNDSLAQKEVYEYYASKMLSVCRSYISDSDYAEDCLIKGFCKVFTKIDSYENKGNFEGWIRKIMVNECLTFLRLNKKLIYLEENSFIEESSEENHPDLTGIDAQNLLDQLPENQQLIFNLYVLEDYSHKEISQRLNISENTSKSNLFRAKEKLRKLVLQQKKKLL